MNYRAFIVFLVIVCVIPCFGFADTKYPVSNQQMLRLWIMIQNQVIKGYDFNTFVYNHIPKRISAFKMIERQIDDMPIGSKIIKEYIKKFSKKILKQDRIHVQTLITFHYLVHKKVITWKKFKVFLSKYQFSSHVSLRHKIKVGNVTASQMIIFWCLACTNDLNMYNVNQYLFKILNKYKIIVLFERVLKKIFMSKRDAGTYELYKYLAKRKLRTISVDSRMMIAFYTLNGLRGVKKKNFDKFLIIVLDNKIQSLKKGIKIIEAKMDIPIWGKIYEKKYEKQLKSLKNRVKYFEGLKLIIKK